MTNVKCVWKNHKGRHPPCSISIVIASHRGIVFNFFSSCMKVIAHSLVHQLILLPTTFAFPSCKVFAFMNLALHPKWSPKHLAPKKACYILLHTWSFFHGPRATGTQGFPCSAQDTFAIIPRHYAQVYFSTWGNPEPSFFRRVLGGTQRHWVWMVGCIWVFTGTLINYSLSYIHIHLDLDSH